MPAKNAPKNDPSNTPDNTPDPIGFTSEDNPEDNHDATPEADVVQDDREELNERYRRRGWSYVDVPDKVSRENVRTLVDENGDPVPMTTMKVPVIDSTGTQVDVVHGPVPTVDWDEYAAQAGIGQPRKV